MYEFISENDLKSLRFENFKTMVLSTIVLVIVYAMYSAFTMDSMPSWHQEIFIKCTFREFDFNLFENLVTFL